jgi:hypothetical protein
LVINGSNCWTIKSFKSVYDNKGSISYIKNPPPVVYRASSMVITAPPVVVIPKPPDKTVAKQQSITSQIKSVTKSVGKSITNLFKKKK